MVTPNENAARAHGVEHVSLETLARGVVGEHRVADPALAQRLIRQAVVREIGGDDPSGIARALAPVVRELFRAGADLDAEAVSERSRRALHVAGTYQRLLRDAGVLDSAEALAEAARSLQNSPARRAVAVRGYPRLSAQEIAFVDAMAADGSVLHLPFAEDSVFRDNREAGEEFRARGWSVGESPVSEPWSPRAECSARAAPDQEKEVREALCRVKELLASGASPEEIVLVARDEAAYGPTVLSVAREYGVPVRALYQIPLLETRLGSWFGSLLSAVEEGCPYEETSRLLAHPLGHTLSDEHWPEVRGRQPSGREQWAEAGVDLSGPGWCGDWPEQDSRKDWAGRVEGLLESHGLRGGDLPWAVERLALARLREGIGWIGAAHGLETTDDDSTLPRDDLVDEVRDLLGTLTVPAQPEGGTGDGVALHTPLSIFGASYRRVFALGLAEGSFPAPVSEEPALDFHERKEIRDHGVHLELAGERARRERLSFWMLLQVPEERITFSYPRLVGRREALPSPFLELVGARDEPDRARPAASVEEARRALLRAEPGKLEDPVFERALRSWEVELKREGSEGFDAHDGVTGIPVPHEERKFAVTELRDLAGCGFKWWAGSVLGLSEPEEGESPARFGSLMHEALDLAVQRAGQGGGGQGGEQAEPVDGGLRQAVLDNLDDAFEEAERELGTDGIRAWSVRREAFLRMLRRAVEGEGFAETGSGTAETEASFSGEWRGLRVRGRVDRLDRAPGGVSLVDYKLGGSAPYPNLQLPIYRETAAPELAAGERVQSVYYYSLRRGERIKAPWPSDGELAAMAEEIKRKLSAGEFPPDAPVKDPSQKACEYCSFDPVCRRGPRLSRKSPGEANEGEEAGGQPS